MSKIGTNLKRLRLNTTKYSQQDVADQLNVDRVTYINWENEATDIKCQYIPRLAEIFNVKINELFQGKNRTINYIKCKDNISGALITINISDKETAEKVLAQIEQLILSLRK